MGVCVCVCVRACVCVCVFVFFSGFQTGRTRTHIAVWVLYPKLMSGSGCCCRLHHRSQEVVGLGWLGGRVMVASPKATSPRRPCWVASSEGDPASLVERVTTSRSERRLRGNRARARGAVIASLFPISVGQAARRLWADKTEGCSSFGW